MSGANATTSRPGPKKGTSRRKVLAFACTGTGCVALLLVGGTAGIRRAAGNGTTLAIATLRSPASGANAFVAGEPIPFRIELAYPGTGEAAQSRDNSPHTPPKARRLPRRYQAWALRVQVGFARVSPSRREPVLTDLDWRSLCAPGALARGAMETVRPGIATVEFVLPPAVTESLGPGKYAATAVFDTRKNPPPGLAPGRIESPAFLFEIRSVNDPAARGSVLASQARFAFDRREFGEAERAAAEAVQVAPQGKDGWFQLGQARAANGKWGAALEAYEKYVALAGDSHRDEPGKVPLKDRMFICRRMIEVEARIRKLHGLDRR